MRNTYLDEDECKKKVEWQEGSTNQLRDLHSREKRKRLGFSLKEKEKEKEGKSGFQGQRDTLAGRVTLLAGRAASFTDLTQRPPDSIKVCRSRWAIDAARWASVPVPSNFKFEIFLFFYYYYFFIFFYFFIIFFLYFYIFLLLLFFF